MATLQLTARATIAAGAVDRLADLASAERPRKRARLEAGTVILRCSVLIHLDAALDVPDVEIELRPSRFVASPVRAKGKKKAPVAPSTTGLRVHPTVEAADASTDAILDLDRLELDGEPFSPAFVGALKTLLALAGEPLVRFGGTMRAEGDSVVLDLSLSVSALFVAATWPETSHGLRRTLLEEALVLARGEEREEVDAAGLADSFYASLRPAPPIGTSITPDLKGKGRAVGDLDDLDQTFQPDGLLPTLLPFQRRSLALLLRREGKRIVRDEAMAVDGEDESAHSIVDIDAAERAELQRGPLWERWPGSDETLLWYNHVTCELVAGELADRGEVRGCGILADEMGTGKTISSLGLILANADPARDALPTYFDADLKIDMQPTSMTLIVCPVAIAAQWQAEIARHAPSLRVIRYEGVKDLSKDETPQRLARRYDIMLVTFDTLRRELNISRKPHERSLRSTAQPRREPTYKRSMLVQLDFQRVLMDEVQLLGQAASAASETVSLVRRRHSWAVSGTPVQTPQDVRSLLKFLRVETVADDQRAMTRLLDPSLRPVFGRLIGALGVRTLKSQVAHELTIPPQSRMVVPVELGDVEGFAHKLLYGQAMAALDLDAEGNAPSAAWRPDPAIMKTFLRRLRHLCCRPTSGLVGGPAGGGTAEQRQKFRTLDDVLDDMVGDNLAELHSEQRARAAALVRRANLQTYDAEDCTRFEHALVVLDEADELVAGLEAELADEMARVRSATDGSPDGEEGDESAEQKTRRLSRETASKRLGALSNRMREVQALAHSIAFIRGNVRFNMGKFPELELAAYQSAERIRSVLLSEDESEANRMTSALKAKFAESELDVTDLEVPFTKIKPGIHSASVFESIAATSDQMNAIAELLWAWRDEIAVLLCTVIKTASEDPTGEEYETAAAQQSELDIRFELYQQLWADWRELLTAERSAMADSFGSAISDNIVSSDLNMSAIRTGKRRATAKNLTLKNQAKHLQPLAALATDPADVQLRAKLWNERLEIVQPRGKNMRDLIGALDKLVVKMNGDGVVLDEDDEVVDRIPQKTREAELVICHAERDRLRKLRPGLQKALEALNLELNEFQKAFGYRVRYFKALQELSDQVAVVELNQLTESLADEMHRCTMAEARHYARAQQLLTTRRYLASLRPGADGLDDADARICSICRDDLDDEMALTSCGHLFCYGCLSSWVRAASKPTCPSCVRAITGGSYKKIHAKAVEAKPEPVVEDGKRVFAAGQGVDESAIVGGDVKLRTIASADLARINSFDAGTASLGVKIDTVLRHIKAIKADDADAKIVLFTAHLDALDFMRVALERNGISSIRLEGGKKNRTQAAQTFANDSGVSVFLLHTHSQAAGLNLTAASTVILFEPLLHPGLELQAVGRIHRIGQTKPTSVFQYFVRDSVDERIAMLQARKGRSLFVDDPTAAAMVEDGADGGDQELFADAVASPRKASGGGAEDQTDDVEDLASCLLEPRERRTLQDCLVQSAGLP